MTDETRLHWSEEKEAVSNNLALRWTLFLMKWTPRPFIYFLIYCNAFIFLIFSKRARAESLLYQKQLKKYTNGAAPKRISPYSQLYSFALCLIEKMYGWLGRISYEKVITHDDDISALVDLLNHKKGAAIITSHLGNMELLRSLTTFNETGANTHFEVVIIMETNSTEIFNKVIEKINPASVISTVNAKDIKLGTICMLQEKISQGALVVYSADRTGTASHHTLKHNFLGREAQFPYGVFLLTILLGAPAFFVFGLRNKTFSWGKVEYDMFVERVTTALHSSKKERDKTISALCGEFVEKLEKYCCKAPYQWYNFYNFWLEK